MLEIKCPSTRPVTGEVPHTYWIQMQMQLEVAGLEVCHFWDNNFAEYQNAAAFESDAHDTDQGLNAAGKERGVLVEARVLGSSGEETRDFAYRYAGIGLSHAELQAWVDKMLDEVEADPALEAHKVTYWHLVNNELAVVKRDRGWFLDVLPRLRAVWGTILYYRSVGVERLKYDIDNGHLRPFDKPFKVPLPKRARAPKKDDPEDAEPLKFMTDSDGSEGGTERDCGDTLVVAVKGCAPPASGQALRFESDSDDALTVTVQHARPAAKRQNVGTVLKAAHKRAPALQRETTFKPAPVAPSIALQFLSDSD
jgi:hypothetical protein